MASVTDPVCGMTIDSESAEARITVEGQVYYFCSVECLAMFEATPERYIGGRADAAPEKSEPLEQHEPPYTTMGFLTSPKFGAAGSGGLEYELLPEAHNRKDA
jgi:YHS domain-containing protein